MKALYDSTLIYTEDLLLYETDSSAAAFDTSVESWLQVLDKWRIPRSRETRAAVVRVLEIDRGTRRSVPAHKDAIFNHEEVKEAFSTDKELEPYRWMWRD